MTLASDNAFPSILITEGTEPAAPAAGKQRLYIDSSTHKLKRTDSSGTDVTIEGSGGISAGTSFPGSPATNDMYFRTDRGLLYFYDGTRWLTVNEYAMALTILDALEPLTTSTGAVAYCGVDEGANGMWLTRLSTSTLVTGSNTGSNYWTLQLKSMSPTITLTNVGSSFATSADTVDNYVKHNVTIGAALTSGHIQLRVTGTKTGTPGGLFLVGAVFYRLIG